MSPGRVSLCPATVPHAAVLAALHAQAFDAPWPAEDFALLLADPGALALLAVGADDVPAGFVLCRQVVDEAEVLTVAVSPVWRRRGVAAMLLAGVAGRLAEAGAATLFLEVAEDNGAARKLYRKLGFDAVGRRPAYYARPEGPPCDALVLRAALPLV